MVIARYRGRRKEEYSAICTMIKVGALDQGGCACFVFDGGVIGPVAGCDSIESFKGLDAQLVQGPESTLLIGRVIDA